MTKMKTANHPARKVILNVIGGAGYLAWVLQLLLLVALYFERLYHSSVGKVIFPTSTDGTNLPPEPVSTPAITLPTSGPFMGLMFALGIALIGIVTYVVTMRYIPAVNKTATKVVHEAAEQTVKQVERTGHKKIPLRKRRLLTARLIWWIKVGISVAPLVIVLLVGGTPLIPKQAAVTSVGALSLWAVLCFTTQIVLARLWQKTVNLDDL